MKRLINDLVWMASIDLQRRYIINATEKQYVVPSELIDVTYGELERICERRHPAERYDDVVLMRARALFEVLTSILPQLFTSAETLDAVELVERDPAWATMRHNARWFLDRLGVDLHREVEKIIAE